MRRTGLRTANRHGNMAHQPLYDAAYEFMKATTTENFAAAVPPPFLPPRPPISGGPTTQRA